MKSFRLMGIVAATVLLHGCGGGGGGGDAGGTAPTVSLASASNVKYSESMLITLSGANLDRPLTLSSAACRDFARSTTAPNVSTASTAYYTCRISGGVGPQTVNVAANGATVVNVAYTVPVPQVSMAISNGAGVAGTLVITLSPTEAPVTVDNFLAYVKRGFYSGLAFHRHGRFENSSTFVLQAGGFAAPLTSGAAFPPAKAASAPIALEAGRGLSNLRYSLAMARTNLQNSATSEFFINTADNVFLDTSGGGYAVFGRVTTGQALVDAMVAAPCNLSPLNFNPPPPNPASTDCLPEPNLVISAALQTQ